MRLAVHLGNQAEEVEMKPPRQVLRRLDRVVEIIDRKGGGDIHAEAEQKLHHPRAPRVRGEGPARRFRAIEEAHIVCAAVADDAKLLLALKERFVDLAIALGL